MPDLDLATLRGMAGLVPGGTTVVPSTGTPTTDTPSLQAEGYYDNSLHIDVPEPRTQPPNTHTIRKTGGIEDLDIFARALEWKESRGRDVEGPAKTPSGRPIADRAQGPMQVTEATAKALGADTASDEWKKGEANRALGKQLAARLYEKYRNWDDVAMAYNAGEAKFDDWVAKGRPDNELGKQLKQYNADVMRFAALDSPGRRMASARATLSLDDLRDMSGGSKEPDAGHPYQEPNSNAAWAQERKEELEENPFSAFATGAMRSLIDIPLGLGQTVLEQLSPTAAAKLTEQVNAFDEKLSPFTDNHPLFNFAGKVFGLTTGVLGAAGLVKAPEWLSSKLPEMANLSRGAQVAVRAGKAATSGALVGGTAFNPSGDPADRLWEAPLGSAFGLLGLGIGSSVAWTVRTVSDQVAQSAFMKEIKDAVGHLTPNMNEVKDVVMERLAVNEARIGQHYGVGGFAAKELGDATRVAVDEGKASPEIKGIAKQVRDILGVTKEEARRAAWERDMERFGEQMEKFQREVDKKAGKGAGPTLKARWAERLGGGPTRPGPFQPQPITTENLAKGMQYLRTQWNRSRDPAVRGTIVRLINRLDIEAGEQAQRILGRNVRGQFTGRPLKEPIESIRSSIEEHFGSKWQTLRSIEGDPNIPGSGVSGMKFYEWVTKTVERGDSEEIATLRRIMGQSQRGDEAIEKVVLHKMLMDAGPNSGKSQFDPKRIAEYIVKHREGLSKVLSKDKWEELEGQARIAERIASLPKAAHHSARVFGWSGFLGIIGLEHAFRGHPVQGAMLAASGFMAHTLWNVLNRISHLPQLSSLVRQAGRMKPESKELDATIEKIMSQYSLRYGAYGRAAWQSQQQ